MGVLKDHPELSILSKVIIWFAQYDLVRTLNFQVSEAKPTQNFLKTCFLSNGPRGGGFIGCKKLIILGLMGGK